MLKIILGVFMVLIMSQLVFAQSENLNIYTDKEVYNYGDYLTFTIEVPKLEGEVATLHISDEFGKSSSPIPILIQNETTTITFPFPFDSVVYIESEYTLEIQYGNEVGFTKFQIIDSGKITIPYWHKDTGRLWLNGVITDHNFIKYMIDNQILNDSKIESFSKEKTTIPIWFKHVTMWWTDGQIHDEDFVNGVNYLVKRGIIKG